MWGIAGVDTGVSDRKDTLGGSGKDAPDLGLRVCGWAS